MRPRRLSALLDRTWEQAVRTPQRFVVLSFAAASLLLLMISAHGLVLLRDHEVQNLQQTQQLQVAGLSSVLNVEAERLRSMRNFAQHLIRLQIGPHAIAPDPPLQAAFAHRNDDVWELRAPEVDAVLRGVGPHILDGMDGYHRRDEDLRLGLYVARGLSHLFSAEPVNPLVTRKLMYVSTNGFFVAQPPVAPADTAATLRRVDRVGYFRKHQPHNNPGRNMLWGLVPGAEGSDDMYLTLSLPVYLNAQFRGVALIEISQRNLDAYLLAETDALTGLSNRRVFTARFAIEHNHTLREHAPMSMLMIDIDRFKRINDHWGHASGDRVLKTLADVVRATVRAIDVPARIGGEEFAVLLPRTSIEEATQGAERLRKILGQTVCEPAADAVGKGNIQFTVSIGVSDLGTNGTESLDTMLMVADRRLYAAKHAGRNRVVSDDRVPEPAPESMPTSAPTA